MTTNDPISDMLTRIRNAAAVGKAEVVIPFSNIKIKLAVLLKEEGYIEDATKVVGFKDSNSSTPNKALHLKAFDHIVIKLKYSDLGKPAFQKLRRVSKPGKRVYCRKVDLPVVLNHVGVAFISTSKGLMTNREAKKQGLGGEIICEVY